MVDGYTYPWYYLDWFSPSFLTGFTWENPNWLYALFGVPVIFLVRWLIKYYYSLRLPVALVQKDLKTSPLNYVRLLPDILLALVVALMIVALARPQKSNERVDQWTEGIDIIIALDISQSMGAQDFTPNRLEAAKQVALKFIKGRKQDRIGVVVFAGEAFSLSPLTTDYELLNSYLRDVNMEMIEKNGTAIGSAMAVVTNRMRESTAKSKVCILLSDGENTGGNIDPITATQLAAAYGIKIYTIIIGKEGPVPIGQDIFGRTMMQENTVDETTMRKIAKIGEGEFFRAEDNRALGRVFSKIDQYEKAEIKETRYRNTTDYYYIYLRWALVLFLLWMLLKSTFITNVLQD